MKKNNISRIMLIQDSVAIGGNLNAFEVLESISNTIESDLSSDGQQVKLKSLVYHIQLHGAIGLYSAASKFFCIQPLIVQSSQGSVADIINLVEGNLSTIIDSGVADEFGYLKLGNLRTSKQLPYDATMIPRIKTRIQVPQHIIDLLNKQSNSERLQDLFSAFTVHTGVDQTIYYTAYAEYTWELISKGITIR
jgi:hypothetical protein